MALYCILKSSARAVSKLLYAWFLGWVQSIVFACFQAYSSGTVVRHTTLYFIDQQCRSASKSPPAKRGRYQPAARGRQASLSSTTSSSSPSPARRHRRYSSSLSPVKRTDRHSRQPSPHSRNRSRRSPSPRGNPRKAVSPRRRTRVDRDSSLPRSRRASPSRSRPTSRARGGSPPSRPRSARSPAGRPRQRGLPPAGGTASSSTSRSPSPHRRRPSSGQPSKARTEQQKAHNSPQKPGKGSASTSQAPKRVSDSSFLPPAPVLAGSKQPPPSTNAARPLPSPAALNPPQPSTSSVPAEPQLADPHGSRAKSVLADQKKASQAPPVAADHKAAAPQGNAAGSAVPKQQPAEVSRSAAVGDQAVAPSLNTPPVLKHQTLPTTTAVQAEPRPVDAAAAIAANAQADTPDHSFDGRQSFISLEVDDAPASGAAPVDQPSPASRKTKLTASEPPSETSKAASVAQPPAVSKAASNKQQVNGSKPGCDQIPQQQLRQQGAGAAASAVTDAADAEADKNDIRPDLFTASRPSSAASLGSGPLQFEADQKQLPPAKSKVAAKGNIQIVLATKHKEVCLAVLHEFLSWCCPVPRRKQKTK